MSERPRKIDKGDRFKSDKRKGEKARGGNMLKSTDMIKTDNDNNRGEHIEKNRKKMVGAKVEVGT